MKEGWEIKTLGEVCKVVGGGTPSKNRLEFYGGTINWASVRDLNSETLLTTEHTITTLGLSNSSTNLIPKNNVIFASRVGLGKVCITKIDVAINQDLRAPIPKNPNQLDVVYLFRWFQNRRDIIIKAGQGATVQGITLPFINNLTIPLPPLSEQQRIVSIIDEAFEAIDKAIENTQKNLQNAKELFESYLNEVFENGGEGWEDRKLNEICRLINGRAFKKEELLAQGKYRVLRVGNFFTNNNWYHSDLELEENKYCDKGDLLYAWSASFGPRIWEHEKVIYHYHIWKVIPNVEYVSLDFLFILFNWDKEKIKAAQGTGTTMIHVSKGSMEERILPLPPLEAQNRIVDQLKTIEAQTNQILLKYQQKLRDLEELKKSVLNKAFAGEL